MSILRGVRFPPVLVGFARGALEAAVIAVILFTLEWLNAADSPEWAKAAAPLAALAWRFSEGYVDQIDPKKSR